VTRHIPIILVTTRGEPENVELGYASGCNDYVTKPINGVELIMKIEDLISTQEETLR
jgi:DNA-binding response OmpR family regulator